MTTSKPLIAHLDKLSYLPRSLALELLVAHASQLLRPLQGAHRRDPMRGSIGTAECGCPEATAVIKRGISVRHSLSALAHH